MDLAVEGGVVALKSSDVFISGCSGPFNCYLLDSPKKKRSRGQPRRQTVKEEGERTFFLAFLSFYLVFDWTVLVVLKISPNLATRWPFSFLSLYTVFMFR